jgi:hypothetical protein
VSLSNVADRENEKIWRFSKHEVAKAIDSLFVQAPLPRPSITHAILNHAPTTSLEKLWRHLYDEKLEKRTKIRHLQKPGSSQNLIPKSTWLTKATSLQNLDYIRLMCQAGVEQDALDRAFQIALANHSMDTMRILLEFGANASANKLRIYAYIKFNGIHLVELLLSVPNAMSLDAWRYSVQPGMEDTYASGKQIPTILLTCLARRPNIACESLFLHAHTSQNLQAMTILHAYAPSDLEFRETIEVACKFATAVEDDMKRLEFFNILRDRKLVRDCLALREELFKDVKARFLPLIKLLVDAGVNVDTEPNNSALWATLHMDFGILSLFQYAIFSSDVSHMLDFIPDSSSEDDIMRLVTLFVHRGLGNEPLHRLLVRAVPKNHIRMVPALLLLGASIEFNHASAVQMALSMCHLKIFYILLRSECSPKVLSAAIPQAMAVQSEVVRFHVMKALVEKEVLCSEIRHPLLTLISTKREEDMKLIQLLLKHKGPVDLLSESNSNSVIVAVQ